MILKMATVRPYLYTDQNHFQAYTSRHLEEFIRKVSTISEEMQWRCNGKLTSGPRQANLVLIAYASSEGSGEPAHPRSLARTFVTRSYKQWIKRNLQTESQIPGPSEWLGMRSWNLSWRNARRHKFAWPCSLVKVNINTVNWLFEKLVHVLAINMYYSPFFFHLTGRIANLVIILTLRQ